MPVLRGIKIRPNLKKNKTKISYSQVIQLNNKALLQIFIPLIVRAIVIAQKERIRRFIRLALDNHLSLFGGKVTFLCIATLAGGNQVCPGMGASARTRDNMIQR